MLSQVPYKVLQVYFLNMSDVWLSSVNESLFWIAYNALNCIVTRKKYEKKNRTQENVLKYFCFVSFLPCVPWKRREGQTSNIPGACAMSYFLKES